MKEATALDWLHTRSRAAQAEANSRRDAAPTRQEAEAVCMKSYRQGQSNAFDEAYRVMKDELARLKNLMQNGALTLSDFDQEKRS